MPTNGLTIQSIPEISLDLLWTASVVILGFQLTSFLWRLTREIQAAEQGQMTWFPMSEILNLLAGIVLCLTVFLLPILGVESLSLPVWGFGLSMILYVFSPLCLAAHYELFRPQRRRDASYFPSQERYAVSLALVAALVFTILYFM